MGGSVPGADPHGTDGRVRSGSIPSGSATTCSTTSPSDPAGRGRCGRSLAALAASTERVLLGPLVASAGFHEPAMLAKLAATVDGISGGRLILGLGSGWNEREYRAFGFPFDRRVSRFAEAFTIIRTLLARRRDRLRRRVLHGRELRAAPTSGPARWAAVDGGLGSTADAVDHAPLRRRVERVVERLRQHS